MAAFVMPVPMTADQNGKAVGARVPPSFLARCWAPSCAISGYETGDPIDGCCQGKALLALILEILCCAGCIVSLLMWQPDPQNIKGDGTQRTVNNKCLAGCCLGFAAIAFWESGDFCWTPDGTCTWTDGLSMLGCLLHFLPWIVCFPSFDGCFVCCFWNPDPGEFKRSTLNHGGGASLTGAPVQMSVQFMKLNQVQQQGAAWGAQPAVVGQPAAQQPVVVATVVGTADCTAGASSNNYETAK